MSAQYWIFELFNQQIPRDANNCRGVLEDLGTNVCIGPYLSSFLQCAALCTRLLGKESCCRSISILPCELAVKQSIMLEKN